MISKFVLNGSLIVVLGLCGCQALHSMFNGRPENFAVTVTSRESLVADLNAKIPAGTSAATARQTLKNAGFEIVPMSAGQTVFAKKKDGFMGNVWMVLCPLADDRVVNVTVTYQDGIL